MAGRPWENYQPAVEPGAAQKGPWEKYATAAPVPPPAPATVAPPAVSGAAVAPAPEPTTSGIATVGRNPTMSTNTGSGPSAKPGELVQAATSGVNSGIMDLAGLPVDAIHGALNLGRRALGMAPDTTPAIGGSESLKNVARKISPSTVDVGPVSNGQDLSGLHTTAGLVGPGELGKGAGLLEKGLEAASDASKALKPVAGAVKPAVSDPIGTARGAGYVLRPSDARAAGAESPGLIREALTSSSGQAKAASIKNQALSTKLAGEHIGVQNATKLTDADYDKYRSTVPGPVYDATADALSNTTKEGKMLPDTEAVSNLNDIASNPNPASAIPPKAASNVQRIAKKIESGNYTGKDWRTDVSWLRANGARDAADELESMAERTLSAGGNTPQVTAFQNARQQFAQSYDLQGATAKRGQVDAQALADLDAKYPHLLTGNLKIIAQAGRALPDVTRVPGGGVADFAASTGHSTGLIAGAGRIAGAAIKHAIPGMNPLSESFQTAKFGRTMTDAEKSYVPDFGKQGAGPSPFAPRMDLTAPPGPNTDPTQLGLALAPGRPAAPRLDLTAPEGEVGMPPNQLGMTLAQGRPAAPQLDLAPPSGEVGVNPVQGQIPLLPPMKQLGDLLAPADERRLRRVMGRREEQSGIPTDSLSIPRKKNTSD